MAAAVPYVLSGLSTASTIKSGADARKGQKEQLAQSERIAAESRANTPQTEREASDMFGTRRRRRTPGFSDAGAASGMAGGTQAAYLGQ
jgi:hypothetical protein